MKKILQEYFNTYQLKMPLEISEIIEISDPVYTFSEVLNHIDLKKYVFVNHLFAHNAIFISVENDAIPAEMSGKPIDRQPFSTASSSDLR